MAWFAHAVSRRVDRAPFCCEASAPPRDVEEDLRRFLPGASSSLRSQEAGERNLPGDRIPRSGPGRLIFRFLRGPLALIRPRARG